MQYLEKNGWNKLNYKGNIVSLKDFKENHLYMMRDDLIPFSFGGNKARKAVYFLKEIEKENYNYIITYGSASSNHCRIIANLCKQRNLKCTIISTELEEKSYNRKMCEIFNAEIIVCNVDKVQETIEEQIQKKREQGYKTYFIQGGGHGNLGTKAYVDAYKEINLYEQERGIQFDYIFHASGTGTTQAGLIIGKLLHNDKAKIVGISIARTLPRGRDIILESIQEYLTETKLENINFQEEVEFIDDYRLGGYGQYNEEILKEIKETLCQEGIPLDTTYTGKAFWGMKQYINKKQIRNKNILFIHTGGTPIFFDHIKELKI